MRRQSDPEPIPLGSGQDAFHEADEDWTGKRVVLTLGGRLTDCGEARIKYTEPFWADPMEQATYEAAVAYNPRRPDEGPGAYIRRISQLVTQEREGGAKAMPHVRQSRREQDRRLMALRDQAGPASGEGE